MPTQSNLSQRGFILPLVIIIIAALAIGGGVYYSHQHQAEQAGSVAVSDEANTDTSNSFTTSPAGSDTTTNSSVVATTSVSANATVNTSVASTGTLKSLMALNQNLKCSYSSTGAGASTGTVYLSGTSMRGDFMLQGAAASNAHMIRQGDDVYVWTGGQGAKMAMSTLLGSNTQASNKTGVDFNQPVSYHCEPWTPSVAQFALPASVNFLDIAAMLKAQSSLNVR